MSVLGKRRFGPNTYTGASKRPSLGLSVSRGINKPFRAPRQRGRGGGSVWQIAKAAARSERETKWVVTTRNSAVDDAGVITSLVGIATGDSQNNREGEKIFLKSLEIRGDIRNENNSSPYNANRLIIFQDWHNTGSDPTVAQVLNSTTPQSVRDQDARNLKRFKILRDDYVVLPGLTSTSNGSGVRPFHHFISINRTIEFSGTASTNTGPGALYILMLSNQSATSTQVYRWSAVTRYQDP